MTTNMDLDKFNESINLYLEYKKTYNHLIQNKEEYNKIRIMRQKIYDLENYLVSNCEDHQKFDIEYLNKHDTIKFINEDNNGNCLICKCSTYFFTKNKKYT